MKDKRGEQPHEETKQSSMRSGIRGLVIVATIVVAMLTGRGEAMAQCTCDTHHLEYAIQSEKRNISTEWGVGIGAVYTGITSLSTTEISLSPRYGLQGHFDMAVCLGRNFAIEAKVIYEGGSIDAKWENLERRIKSRNVDIPVLLSLRFLDNRIRLSAGPLFSVKSSGEYSVEGDTYFYGPVTPTWNVAAGVGIRLTRHLIIEARYVHPLMETVNQFGAKQNTEDSGVEFNTRCYKLQAGITLLF